MIPRFNLGALLDPQDDSTFIVDCRTDEPVPWSSRDIETSANAIARGLLRRGLRRGDRVAILSQNRAEFVAAYFATMRAGLISVPVNTKLPTATIAYVLADCGAKFAFVDAANAPLCPTSLPSVNFDDDSFRQLQDPGNFTPIIPEPGEVAMFLYTSGSTGKPKGVPLTHAGHLWVIERRYQPQVDYAAQRMLVAAPLYHMNALAIAKFAAAVGATIVLLPQFSAKRYIGAIAQHHCTWLTSVPTMLALVVQETDMLANTDLRSVQSVRMGSAPVTEKLLGQVREAFPGTTVQLGYGTTESGPVAFGAHPQGLRVPDLALGYPDAEVDLRLVAGDDKDATTGVLEIRCPAVTPGYHQLADKTAAAMTSDGYYRTGDIMRRDAQGFYYFVGRDDDMFVCNGENVFPEEVERILEGHQDVLQACVIPVDDEVRGQMPVAFVVLRASAACDENALKQHALANGPAYQHPRHIFFRSTLPLAGTNKYDRHMMKTWAAEALAAPESRIKSPD